MRNRVVMGIGYGAYGCHLVVLLLYFFTLLGNPNGASMIIPLIIGVPFLLLGVAGCWMIGRIQWIPTIYLVVSAGVLALLYWNCYSVLANTIATVSLIVGAVAVLLSVIVALLAFSARRNYPNRKELVIGSLVALGLLCLAAVFFLFLSSLLVLPGDGVSSLPISGFITSGF